jgi:hypothetical protein
MIIYKKYVYRLLLNVVLAEIGPLVWGNTFLYACVKKVFRLSAPQMFCIVKQ